MAAERHSEGALGGGGEVVEADSSVNHLDQHKVSDIVAANVNKTRTNWVSNHGGHDSWLLSVHRCMYTYLEAREVMVLVGFKLPRCVCVCACASE